MFNIHRKRLISFLVILVFILIICFCVPRKEASDTRAAAALQAQTEADPYGGAKYASITVSDAEVMLKKQFGTKKTDSGQTCTYCFNGVETVNGTEYYSFEWRCQVKNNYLCLGNLFVATDGSAAWIAVQNADGKWVLNTKTCGSALDGTWTSSPPQQWELQCGGVFLIRDSSEKSSKGELCGVWASDETERMLTIFVDGSSLSGDYLFSVRPDGSILLHNLATEKDITLTSASPNA